MQVLRGYSDHLGCKVKTQITVTSNLPNQGISLETEGVKFILIYDNMK